MIDTANFTHTFRTVAPDVGRGSYVHGYGTAEDITRRGMLTFITFTTPSGRTREVTFRSDTRLKVSI